MLLEALVNVFQAILAHVASFKNFLYFLRSRFPSHLAQLLLLVFSARHRSKGLQEREKRCACTGGREAHGLQARRSGSLEGSCPCR